MTRNTAAALLTLALGLLPVTAGHAGLTDKEKALWGASASAPTTFSLPAGGDVPVMAKAAALLSDWATRDRYMYAMPVLTHTETLIQTEDPTQLNEVGFKVTDTRTANGSVITINVSAFEGKIFQAGQQRRDADKRAHLLAYLLEQSAGLPTASAPATVPLTSQAPPQAALPPLPSPTLPIPSAPATSLDTDVDRLRAQLDTGQYDAALKTLDSLRAAIAGRH